FRAGACRARLWLVRVFADSWSRLFGNHFVFRLGKEKANDKRNDENAHAGNAGSHGVVIETRVRVQPRRDDIRREKCCRGSDHPPADVGREGTACSAKMHGKNFRQVFAKVRELRDDEQTAQKNSSRKLPAADLVKLVISNGENHDPWHEKEPKHSTPGNRGEQKA